MAQYNACHSSRSSRDATGHVGHRPRQHGGIKNPPGNDTIQRQAALQALATCELPCFNATPAFQNPVPDFNAPATGVPLDTLDSVVDRLDRHGGQQQPRDGRDVRWRLDFLDLDGPQRDRRQAFALAMLGGTQRQGTKPQRQCRVPGGLRATTRHVQLEVGAHRLCRDRGPDIALRPPGHTGPTRRESADRRPPGAEPPTRHRHRLPDRPTLTKRVVGQQSRAVYTASRLWSHF